MPDLKLTLIYYHKPMISIRTASDNSFSPLFHYFHCFFVGITKQKICCLVEKRCYSSHTWCWVCLAHPPQNCSRTTRHIRSLTSLKLSHDCISVCGAGLLLRLLLNHGFIYSNENWLSLVSEFFAVTAVDCSKIYWNWEFFIYKCWHKIAHFCK